VNIENRENLSDYQKWVSSNEEKKFSLFDYIHGVFSLNDLSSDLAIALMNLFFPRFLLHDDLIFLQEEFSKKRYDSLISSGISGHELEYWMNILNIDTLINCSSVAEGVKFAESLVPLWE